MHDSIPSTNPEVAISVAGADLAAKVAARAQAMEAKVPEKVSPAPAASKPNNAFILDCLYRNRVGDAALFCELFRGKYIFVQEWEKFLYWTGQYWAVDMRNMRALADAERVCQAYIDACAKTNDPADSPLHKLLKKHVDALRSQRGRREMLDCVTTIDDAPVISAEQLDSQPYLLATPTGVVDLRTGDCSPGKPDQYLTSPCPTPWAGLDTPCPNFRHYLLTCMADDQEMADFIVRLLGYGLLGEKTSTSGQSCMGLYPVTARTP